MSVSPIGIAMLAGTLLLIGGANTVAAQDSRQAAAGTETVTNAHAATMALAREHFKAQAFDKAFAESITLADAGHPPALHLVGRIHLQPSYANFDPHESARLLEQAAEKGYAPAQHDLAELLRRGLGLPRDSLLAFRWHLNAAEQRYRMSELAIADMYARGEGVATNQQQASVWRARARREYKNDSTKKQTGASPPAAKTPAKPPRKHSASIDTPQKKHTRPRRATPSTAGGSNSSTTRASHAKPSGHRIQLGAYTKKAAAAHQRNLLLEQLRRISPNVQLTIASYDQQDGRGTLHRLRTQPMDLGSARFLCGKLKKILPERGCFIVSGKP